MPSLDDVLAIILAGGGGTGLYPLTIPRSVPAIPIAGKYRLIDIPISNCINSGIDQIAVLTQFNSVSLHRHLTRGYQSKASRFHPGWVQYWAAQQTNDSRGWYQGTADAIRKQMLEIRSTRAKYVLILASDHLYRMDYSRMAQFHWQNNADVTIAVHPVSAADAFRFGILKCDPSQRVISFFEKPKDTTMLMDEASCSDLSNPFLGSMGIYLFNTQILYDLLEEKTLQDFGYHVIPRALECCNVFGFNFEGYWEDIGDIRSFYETNLMLGLPDSPFNFYDEENPIYTDLYDLPCSTIENCSLDNVLLSEGCNIQDATIRHSVIGVRSQVRSGVEIVDSILMGADEYDDPIEADSEMEIPLGIGENSRIAGAIIDKNARIGKNVTILPFPRGVNLEGDDWVVRDGIVVISKGARLKSGTHIEPRKEPNLQENEVISGYFAG